MGLKRTSDPALRVVSVELARDHIKNVHGSEVSHLSLCIDAATNHVEDICNRALITQTYQWTMDTFPDLPISVPRSPLQSITSIVYVDTNGSNQTWASSNYSVDTVSHPGRIGPSTSITYPSDIETDIISNTTITFVAGYGDNANSVPAEYKQAILLMTATLFRNREQDVSEQLRENPVFDRLIDPLRRYHAWV